VETSSVPRTKTILLVDGSDGRRLPTKWFLNNFGYAVDSVRTAEEALMLFEPSIHDMVITDQSKPGMMSGVEMAHVIKMRSPSTFVVMYSGRLPQDTSCFDLFLPKPGHLLVLADAVEKLFSSKGL